MIDFLNWRKVEARKEMGWADPELESGSVHTEERPEKRTQRRARGFVVDASRGSQEAKGKLGPRRVGVEFELYIRKADYM